MSDEPIGLLLADDLMWISRITSTAQALGFKVLAARTVERLEELTRQHRPVCVILDLGVGGVQAGEIVPRIRATVSGPLRIAAYGSHVDVATLQAARAAGCDPVLPRSKMAEELPELLKQWLGG
jgi:CheY-like chemotaxis protein